MKQMRSLKRQGGWWQIAVAAVSVASSLIGGGKAKKAARRINAANAALIKLETEEELRRMDLTQEQVMGEANARAAASGFEVDRKFGGDTDYQKYFDELEGEYGERRKWTIAQGAARQRVAAAGGSAAKNTIQGNQTSDIINAISTAVSSY